jgi:transcriptional regulator with XRE-family HTH domain
MSEQDAFGPGLRRQRVQRGITLEQIAAATKIGRDLWAAMERNDFSRWPKGIYARAYLRAYALETGADPDVTVDEFCRWFPEGDRRAERVVREQAALMGHDLRWNDDRAAESNRRASSPAPVLPPLAFSQTGRIVAALSDASVVLTAGLTVSATLPIGKASSVALCAILYHALALVMFGCSPAAWAIDTYVASRHPAAPAPGSQRFPRLQGSSERVKAQRA